MPQVIIVAGPNGAGKTTFASEYLPTATRGPLNFVNADEIAMKRESDVERIDAALKHAAYRAIHGSREERSGRFLPTGEWEIASMANKKHELYVERRPQGDDAVRREGTGRASITAPTQKAAIEKAEKLDPEAAILVERVRDTDIGGRDKWRKA